MDSATVGTWNQTDVPTSAVAVFPGDHVPSNPPTATDWEHAQVSYYDTNGIQVDTASYGNGAWDIATMQFDAFGDEVSQLSAADRAEALAAGGSSASVAAELSTVIDYTASSDGSELTDHVYGPLHNASIPGQGVLEIRNEVHYVYDQNSPGGGTFDLVTLMSQKASIGAGIPGTEADVYTTDYNYSVGSDNTGWTLRSPLQTVVGPGTGGLQITATTQYNESSTLYGGEPLVTATCLPSDSSCSGAGTTQYIYYTGGTNPLNAACGNHAMWADQICMTQPAAQPGTAASRNHLHLQRLRPDPYQDRVIRLVHSHDRIRVQRPSGAAQHHRYHQRVRHGHGGAGNAGHVFVHHRAAKRPADPQFPGPGHSAGATRI